MMWFLEHLEAPDTALREARRVLVPQGRITVIEADYSTIRVRPATRPLEALLRALVSGMAASGHSDAGVQVGRWLTAAGFADVLPGRRRFSYDGDDAAAQVIYIADVIEDIVPALSELPGVASGDELHVGLRDLRARAGKADTHIEFVVYKASAKA
jgi:hypothetical protein